ncbi:glycoside hydrolase superfamily, partial [Podospora didyma]
LEQDIKQCQARYGKKVLLSLGGAGTILRLETNLEALRFANLLWALFGPPGNLNDQLRPFGSAVLDDFDLDENVALPAHFDSLCSLLRANFANDLSKDYFFSAAPQCNFPDISIPMVYILQ